MRLLPGQVTILRPHSINVGELSSTFTELLATINLYYYLYKWQFKYNEVQRIPEHYLYETFNLVVHMTMKLFLLVFVVLIEIKLLNLRSFKIRAYVFCELDEFVI